MRRQYAYKGYLISVGIDGFTVPALDDLMMSPFGFTAYVTVTRKGEAKPVMSNVQINDRDGVWFLDENVALRSGCVEGQRLVDDLVSI